ncbi:hypothetical protein, partial [Atopobium sp. oral taxon 810]|uniref:hypothetical protein n=1 Tax=Atopobium sp. oral taxon 810 TaxID=712158 RepID=UPI0003962BDE
KFQQMAHIGLQSEEGYENAVLISEAGHKIVAFRDTNRKWFKFRGKQVWDAYGISTRYVLWREVQHAKRVTIHQQTVNRVPISSQAQNL